MYQMKLFCREMFIVLCLLVLGVAHSAVIDDLLVETKQGLIKGIKSDDGASNMFLGIPFGKVDKNNPFGVSTPYPKHEGTFLANDDTVKCPQIEEFNNTMVGVINCLNLNVYVPSGTSSKDKLPVLVWVFGGGFHLGFAGRYLYGPKYINRQGVILVSMNYRLGPYGFMCLHTPEVPGNQGLKDQLLALRWVKNNIEYFGGDKNKVTLGGESAGAGAVDFHLWSKQEKLFNQVILQGGATLCPWAFTGYNYSQPFILAELLGYRTDNLTDALSYIAKVDEKTVIETVENNSMLFRICVEKEIENVERFVTDYPRNMNVTKAKDTGILIGYTNQESMGFFINDPESDFQAMDMINFSLNERFKYDKDFYEMEDIMRHFYLGDEKISKAVQFDIIDFSSDHYYVYPIQESIQTYLDNGAENIYHYFFTYGGERNLMKKKDNITEGGAVHADELSYIFDMIYDPSPPSKEDQKVIDMTSALWTNFVKYGNPTPEPTELLPVKWLPVTKKTLNYLEINLELSQGKTPYKKRMAFWRLFLKANKDRIKHTKT